MRVVRLWLLLILVDVLLISLSISMNSQAVALSGTGVGIRLEGVALARLGEQIEYVITAQNLGDYWITNTTVTNTLPNGTSLSWKIPDLAPQGKSGNSFNVSNIFYTVKYKDVSFVGNLSIVVDHAQVGGYSVIQGLKAVAFAKTDYYTFLQGVPVGGYSVNVKISNTSVLPAYIYDIVLFTITSAFCIFAACKKKRILK